MKATWWTAIAAIAFELAGCGDDAPVPVDAAVDAAPVDAPECCLPGCPAPAPECCTTPDDPRPVCD